ncbi:MAG: DUF4156 domain-containing protein [Pseudomonadota bacterium]|uniref:DUF4156 domain-containing protein n=1 Tax=Pseudohongiella sp. O18 TaxID=2904248 RepID=UPI001F48BE49|nr:DUF4156 domain-containing protein [Pseudohongiella sp. O18]MEC8859431.1 DUF4156 domain-containing protein [Pseudomonadota bacterium]
MSLRTTRHMTIVTIIAAMTACSSNWVQLSAAGQSVSVVPASEVRNCNRLGTANVNAADNIAFVQRGANTLQEELTILARNEAGAMGGNRVTPESTIEEGRQTFGVFRC